MIKATDIRGYNLFSDLDDNELNAIAGISTRRNYPVNSIISEPDNCAMDVLLLEDGNEAIQMEIPMKDGSSKIVIHTLSKGEVFCWIPLCPAHARAATIRTIQPATVIAVDGASLRKLLKEDEHTGYIVMRNLSCIISARLSYVTMVFSHEIQKHRKLAAV